MSFTKRSRSSFFLKVVAAFFVVMMLIYLMCFGLYQSGYQLITNEISSTLSSRADFFASNLEEEIIRIKKLQYECLNDESLYYFINSFPILSEREKRDGLLDIQKRLYLLHNSSPYISVVTVYIPELNRQVSSTEGVDSLTEEWKAIWALQKQQPISGLTNHQSSLHLYTSYPFLPVDTEKEPLFILDIQLSEIELKQNLLSFNSYPESGTFLADQGSEYRLLVGRDIGLLPGSKEDVSGQGEWPAGSAKKVISTLDGREYVTLRVGLESLEMEMYTYVASDVVYGSLYRYRNLFIAFNLAMIIMFVVYIGSVNVFINRPIKILVNSLTKLEHGELKTRIPDERRDEFSYLYTAFNQMAESLENMLEINYRQQMLMQQAELRNLQAQINPHFLYNSFFILYRMAKDEDYENITEFLTYLSEYYRYITRSSQPSVPLQAEVDHARRYAQIQALRFKRRIRVDFDPLPEEFSNLTVPKLILQPLLENAFEHGLRDVEENGLLCIHFESDANAVLIHVEDNGAGISEQGIAELYQKFQQESGKIEHGLANIHQRLVFAFGPEYGIIITARQAGGTRCTLRLPAPGTEEKEGQNV